MHRSFTLSPSVKQCALPLFLRYTCAAWTRNAVLVVTTLLMKGAHSTLEMQAVSVRLYIQLRCFRSWWCLPPLLSGDCTIL